MNTVYGKLKYISNVFFYYTDGLSFFIFLKFLSEINFFSVTENMCQKLWPYLFVLRQYIMFVTLRAFFVPIVGWNYKRNTKVSFLFHHFILFCILSEQKLKKRMHGFKAMLRLLNFTTNKDKLKILHWESLNVIKHF